jgi:hypothetical protein
VSPDLRSPKSFAPEALNLTLPEFYRVHRRREGGVTTAGAVTSSKLQAGHNPKTLMKITSRQILEGSKAFYHNPKTLMKITSRPSTLPHP